MRVRILLRGICLSVMRTYIREREKVGDTRVLLRNLRIYYAVIQTGFCDIHLSMFRERILQSAQEITFWALI